ncbi:MAG: hypothetical protein ACI4ED_01405 [Suilimivivens sp.]
MKIKQHPYLICFFVFTFLTFAELIIVNAFSWASFAGFGFGNLKYSEAGITAYYICISIPFSIGFIFFVARLVTLHHQNEALIKYFSYILTTILGISTGIIFFLFDDSLGGYIRYYGGGNILMKLIKELDWVQYPF